jgi:hypothetical protein
MDNKKILSTVFIAGLILTSGMAWAQGQTSSGTLTVRAELASSINLTFLTDANGVALTGSGTNVATLDFGAVSQFTFPLTTVPAAATSLTVTGVYASNVMLPLSHI